MLPSEQNSFEQTGTGLAVGVGLTVRDQNWTEHGLVGAGPGGAERGASVGKGAGFLAVGQQRLLPPKRPRKKVTRLHWPRARLPCRCLASARRQPIRQQGRTAFLLPGETVEPLSL